MRIYVAHSTKMNFKENLYQPLKDSKLSRISELILPHDESMELYNSKALVQTFDYMICEISEASTGMGIEVGWADVYGVKLIGLVKKGTKVSKSFKSMNPIAIIEYTDNDDLTTLINRFDFRNQDKTQSVTLLVSRYADNELCDVVSLIDDEVDSKQILKELNKNESTGKYYTTLVVLKQ